MASRFYLQASGSTPISPTPNAGWEQIGSVVRRPMPRKTAVSALTALTDSAAITIPITTTQRILAFQHISEDVFAPARLDASVLFSFVMRASENATTNNAFLAYVLRAVGVDGSALATLSSSLTNAGTEYALTASAATRIFGPVAIAAVTLSVPWRLVLEHGVHAQAPTAAGSFIHRVGSSAASDFALTSALTTDLNPWMELSLNLNALSANTHKAVKVASGMSTGERVR